ncbi:hypothetical protein [Streptomyces sp. NPDC057557]|uniref:hypothetical protein n=1 Tax=Streptomyces sp. NPDC057557 TaxID=3346167 RepID=UPI0036855DE3
MEEIRHCQSVASVRTEPESIYRMQQVLLSHDEQETLMHPPRHFHGEPEKKGISEGLAQPPTTYEAAIRRGTEFP